MVFAAPGRVNLIGEHMDYNGGLCLPMALPHATYAACGRAGRRRARIAQRRVRRAVGGPPGRPRPRPVTGWAAYAAGVAVGAGRGRLAVPGLDVVVDSRVPVGAGLSSSAALECAVAMAVAELAGAPSTRSSGPLLAACMRAEPEVAGAPTGGMDQTIALFGGAGGGAAAGLSATGRRARCPGPGRPG